MKNFLALIFGWYAQDIVQIMMTQTFLAPEIYLMMLIWCVTQEKQLSVPWRWFAAALCGGLLMDLRWIGVPGYMELFIRRRFWLRIGRGSRFPRPTVGRCPMWSLRRRSAP